MLLNKQYMNMYVVGAVITACFLFMIFSTGFVMGGISNKTSADLALEKMQKQCEAKNGTLVTKNENIPLQSYCVTEEKPQ